MVRTDRRLLIVWVVLALLTVSYLWLDHSAGGTQRSSVVITSTVIVIALVKVRIIFREFMEVRRAPVLLRRLTDVWVLLIAGGLFGSYFVGLALR
jgi:hypothetical protein